MATKKLPAAGELAKAMTSGELISAECKFRVDKYEWISPKQINVFYTPQS